MWKPNPEPLKGRSRICPECRRCLCPRPPHYPRIRPSPSRLGSWIPTPWRLSGSCPVYPALRRCRRLGLRRCPDIRPHRSRGSYRPTMRPRRDSCPRCRGMGRCRHCRPRLHHDTRHRHCPLIVPPSAVHRWGTYPDGSRRRQHRYRCPRSDRRIRLRPNQRARPCIQLDMRRRHLGSRRCRR